MKNKKIKIALIVDEYFGALGTAYGGYGFLARRYIARYIPNTQFQLDVLIGKAGKSIKILGEKTLVDGVNVYKVPKKSWVTRQWLKMKNYDVYLSIELVDNFVMKNVVDLSKKLILWIQDPRPVYEWEEINTVKLFPEYNYYNQEIYDTVNHLYRQGRVKFISQAHFLNKKAKDLYRLDDNVDIQYLPNPIDIDYDFNVKTYRKKDNIIFLGRIESVKRGWIFCEIAKAMPQYNFYMLGQTYREAERNSLIINRYQNVSNLHFVGHVDGEEKAYFLKEAKILVNTSIHEALPISFLEALSYGTLLVSNRNPDNLTSKFGISVGDVLGDGFDKVGLFIEAINTIMNNDEYRQRTAEEAVLYIREVHNVPKFVNKLREIIVDTINET